jgi:hypothetical protein
MSIPTNRYLHSTSQHFPILFTDEILTYCSETGETYNYFVKSMNDYIRSTFGRSMRIVSRGLAGNPSIIRRD